MYCIFLWSGWSACAVSPSRLSLSLLLSLMNNIKLPGEATLNTWNAWKPFGCRSSAWTRLGKITALLGPLTGGEGAGCPLSREPIPAVGPAGLRLQSFLQLGRKKNPGYKPVLVCLLPFSADTDSEYRSGVTARFVWTWFLNKGHTKRQTDRRTDGRTDGRTDTAPLHVLRLRLYNVCRGVARPLRDTVIRRCIIAPSTV